MIPAIQNGVVYMVALGIEDRSECVRIACGKSIHQKTVIVRASVF